MKSIKTKACDISQKVKKEVYERDNGLCVVCHRQGMPNAHYIPRSQGGLGIKENIVTLCPQCHHEFDHGMESERYEKVIREYLDKLYPDFPDSERYYHKWEGLRFSV